MAAETAEAKKAREAAERKKATLDALKKRGQDQIDDSMIKTGEEVLKSKPGDSGAAGARAGAGGFMARETKTGYKDTPASPPPTVPTKLNASPVPPPTTGNKQAEVLNKPAAAQSKPKPYSEMSLPEKAEFNRKQKEAAAKGGKK